MSKLKTSISISTKNLLEFAGNDVTLSEHAAKDIETLLSIESKIQEIKDQFSDALLKEMEKKNTMHIERGKLVIKRLITGHKYAFDPAARVDQKYSKIISYPAVNSEAVDAYLIFKGELPKGIIEKGRKYSLTIKNEI